MRVNKATSSSLPRPVNLSSVSAALPAICSASASSAVSPSSSQSGVLRRQRGLLVREIHLHVGRRSLLFRLSYDRFGRRLDPGALRTRRLFCGSRFRSRFGDGLFGQRFAYGRLGGGRCGFALRDSGRFGFCNRSRFGIRDFGSHFGSCLLHIFSSLADLLLRSRKNRIFSSHLNTRF